MRPHTQTASTVKSAHFEKMLHIKKLREKFSFEERIMRPWILQMKDYLKILKHFVNISAPHYHSKTESTKRVNLPRIQISQIPTFLTLA